MTSRSHRHGPCAGDEGLLGPRRTASASAAIKRPHALTQLTPAGGSAAVARECPRALIVTRSSAGEDERRCSSSSASSSPNPPPAAIARRRPRWTVDQHDAPRAGWHLQDLMQLSIASTNGPPTAVMKPSWLPRTRSTGQHDGAAVVEVLGSAADDADCPFCRPRPARSPPSRDLAAGLPPRHGDGAGPQNWIFRVGFTHARVTEAIAADGAPTADRFLLIARTQSSSPCSSSPPGIPASRQVFQVIGFSEVKWSCIGRHVGRPDHLPEQRHCADLIHVHSDIGIEGQALLAFIVFLTLPSPGARGGEEQEGLLLPLPCASVCRRHRPWTWP